MHTARFGTTTIVALTASASLLGLLPACGGDQKRTAAPAPAASAQSDNDLLAQLAADAGADELILPSDAGASGGPTTTLVQDAGGPVSSTTVATSNDNDECGAASAKFEGEVRPKFNDCYQEGKKKNPDLAGEIRITVSVDYKGKITSVKATGGKEQLGEKVVACMTTAVKKTPFDGAASCRSKAIIVGKKFGK